MTKFIELKTDRSIIKTNFDGYKLSLENVPVIRTELTNMQLPTVRKPTADQYSFLHTELFSMQNLLVQDPWNREFSYYVGNDGLSIFCSNYKESTGRPTPQQTVFEFLNPHESEEGCYNFSFKFISEKFLVFCDGYKCLSLFETGDRYKMTKWKQVFTQKIDSAISGFLLKDARLDIFDGKKIINCVFQHISFEKSKHLNELHWGTLNEIQDTEQSRWTWQLKDVLKGKGQIYYCAFELKSASLVLCANKAFEFESKISNQKENDENSTLLPVEILLKDDQSLYYWTQNEDDVVIYFEKTEYKNKDDFTVTCTDEMLQVKCGERFLIENGKLCDKIDSELTTWFIENDALQITLMKKDCKSWNFFIEDGPPENTNENTFQINELENQPIANLETPVEDCDMATNLDEEYSIERINLESKTVTHKIPLGNHPPLFATILRPGFPAALATRTDVDASLWLQQYNPLKADEWGFRHEGNLHAFGYVQASKKQKKYIDCAPDLGYSVISEPNRHVFIYNSKYETANNLRNRSGPQVTLGKQNLITLENTGEIIGMSAGIDHVTLLSEEFLLYIQINKQS